MRRAICAKAGGVRVPLFRKQTKNMTGCTSIWDPICQHGRKMGGGGYPPQLPTAAPGPRRVPPLHLPTRRKFPFTEKIADMASEEGERVPPPIFRALAVKREGRGSTVGVHPVIKKSCFRKLSFENEQKTCAMKQTREEENGERQDGRSAVNPRRRLRCCGVVHAR